jgi:serine/threonine-protein kinase
MGAYAEAVARYDRALGVLERALGPEHHQVATTLVNLGMALHAQGDVRRPTPLFERAVAIQTRTMGPDHPNVAFALVGLGRAEVALGRLDEARAALERAQAIREKAGPDHPDLAEPLLGLGELHLARRRPADALPPLERALRLHNRGQEASIRLTLAEALWQSGGDRARARALAGEARESYERMRHAPGLAAATRWLAAHADRDGG